MKRFDIDASAASVAALRLWTAISGATTVVIVPMTLNASEQGLFFILQGLMSLQYIAELGFGVGLVQQVAAVAPIDLRKQVTHKIRSKSLVQTAWFMRASALWYGSGAVIFFCIAAILASYYIPRSAEYNADRGLIIYYAVLLSISLNILCLGIWAFFDGAGRIIRTSNIRSFTLLIGSIILWLGLFGNLGLTSLAIAQLSQSIAALILALWLFRHEIKNLLQTETCSAGLTWRKNIWPFQGKIAVSVGAHALTQALILPMSSYFIGIQATGRLGFALQIARGVQYVSSAILAPCAPVLTKMIAKGRITAMRKYWQRKMKQTAVLTVLGYVIAAFLIYGILPDFVKDPEAIVTPTVFWAIGTYLMFTQLIYGMSVLARAHRVELFATHSLVSSALTLGIMMIALLTLGEPSVGAALGVSSMISCLWAICILKNADIGLR